MSQTVNRLQILALIPACGGSKGIPNNFDGKSPHALVGAAIRAKG
ncbi:MAG: hypothetical protein HFACDABA_02018 [Anaerolineales bacterium]|nr:hypothetical protein [Anaerolineales bacterium]